MLKKLIICSLLLMPMVTWAEVNLDNVLHDSHYQVWCNGKNVTQEFYGRQIVAQARGWKTWPHVGWVDCDPNPDPCLAKMEAAMRAMEPYLPVVESIVLRRPDLLLQYDNVVAGWKQWAVAKQCWRTP